MSTTLAAADDPYVLPAPAPDTPVVLPQWINAGNHHPGSRFRDAVWSLAQLVDSPGTSLLAVHWRRCPPVLRDQLKTVAWTMINGQLRPTRLQGRGVRARGRSSAAEMADTCREWIRLARWLHERGIDDLAACTQDHWAAYTARRWEDGVSRNSGERIPGRLTALWAFDRLTARPAGIAEPAWEAEGSDDHLPAGSGGGGGENSTEPLDPQVIGPLLVWAIRMVEDFADDILAGWSEKRRLADLAATTPSPPAGRAALEAYLLPLVRAQAPLPATRRGPAPTVARLFVAATTGASPLQVDRFVQIHRLGEAVAARPGPCPLRVPVTGRIEGRPWREHLDFAEAGELMRHLGTAAMIICLYLTGMRPQEKGAELRLMQHSAGRATLITTGGRGCLCGHRARGNRSASGSCARRLPSQQCCI
ncbi:hypothetical protein [Kitasatospora sp. NPDC059327]|uniref:hypothetical protein n=1 Tax=Kitasatospora sp. NPDC059327 TaxID=3346803 RepID=UPI00368D805B